MKSVVVLSFALTLAVIIAIVAFVAISGQSAEAATYTLTASTPNANWSDTTKWTGGPAGTYPGQSSGDTAIINNGLTTVNVDVNVLNPVNVQMTSFNPIQVSSSATLTLESSSSATSSNTFTVNSGGILGVSNTANLSTWQGPITLSGGTFNVAGSITLTGGAPLTFNGGTIQGGGSVTSSSTSFTGTTSGMTLSNVTFNNASSASYTSSTNLLAINNGTTFNNQSGATFTLSGSFITTDNGGTPKINNQGTLGRSGAGTSTIAVQVDNNGGTIDPGSGTIELDGGGTHTGVFSLAGSTGRLRFGGGTHNVNAGASVAATPLGGFELSGGTLNINTPISVPTMKQTGGTLAGTSTFSTSSAYDWAGGNQGDGVNSDTTSLGSSTLTIDPTTPVTLNKHNIAGGGSWTYNPGAGGSLALSNGAQMNLGGGTFNLLSDTTITGDSASSINILGGTLTKSAGTKTSVGVPLNINGNGGIQPQGNVIAFANGGSIGGTSVTVDTSISGSQIEFSSSTTNLNGGVVFNSGNLAVTNSGILSVNSPYTITNLTQSGGTLVGSAVLTTGQLNWTGGAMDGSAGGTGGVSISSPNGVAFLNGSAATQIRQHWTLTNGGTVHYSPATALGVDFGGQVVNNGTFALENATSITSNLTTDGSANPPAFKNSGTLSKTISGTTTFGVPLSNAAGAITLNNGADVELTGGGTIAGGTVAFNNAADILGIQTTPVTISSTPTINGSGRIRVSSNGTLTNSAPTSLANFQLDNSGTLNGASTLTITSNLKWSGGTMSGGGTTTLGGSAIGDITAPTGPPTLTSRTFNNQGTINYNPSQSFTFGGAAALNNSGTFNIAGNGATSNSGAGNSFTNTGNVTKISGGGLFTFTVPFVNNAPGVVDDQDPASTIAFNANGDQINGGTVKASNANASIDMSGGSMSMGGGSFAGPGPIKLSGALLFIFTTPQTLPPIFNMTGGTLNNSIGVTVPNAATFSWSGGTITGSNSAPITIQSGGTMSADTTISSLIYDVNPLVINSGGNLNWNAGTNSFIVQSGANVANAGTFTVGTNATLGSATGSLTNTGLFKHTGAGTLTVTLALTNSGGTVSSQGGILALNNASTVNHTGTFDAQSGKFLDFGAGTHNLNAGSSFTGTGTFKVAGAALNANTNVSAANIGLLTGTIGGSGNVTTTSTFSWAGGTMNGGGTTIVSGGTASLTNGALTLARNLTLSGNTTFSAASGMSVQGGAVITNNATFDIQNGNISCVCTPVAASFANNGTLQKSTSSTVTFGLPVTGAGTLNTLFGGTLTDTADATFSSATINGTLTLNGNVSIATVSGSNVINQNGGSLTVSGTFNLTGGFGSLLNVLAGTVTLNGTSTIDGIGVSPGATLTGAGNITLNQISNWSGGTISGTGTLTNNHVTQGFNVTGTGNHTLSRNFINNGSAGFANVSVSPGVTISNNGFFALGGDVLALPGSPVATFVNAAAGNVQRQVGTTPLTFDPSFSSAGTFGTSPTVGSTIFTNGFTQTGGTSTFTAPLSSPAGFTINGGTFAGASTLTGNVINNAGTVTPYNGTAPAVLTLNGNYTQSGGGTLQVKINGTTAGSQYGQMNVSGNVNLAGGLTVVNPLGYTPANGDTYDVLTFTGTRTGDFTAHTFPPPGPVGFLQANYVAGPPAALEITAVTQTVDVGVTQSGPASVNQGQTATITLTVGNTGPSNASSVVLTDTFSGASFVSATPSIGSCSGSGPITCNLGTLATGNTATVTLVFAITNVGTITNNASVTTTTFDTNTANNTAPTLNIAANPSADLATAQSAPAAIAQGQNATIVVTVNNSGPSAASGVTANVSLAGGTFVSATPSSGSCSGTLSLNCSLGTMAASGSATISIIMNGSSVGTITSNATAASATFDPNGANNGSSAGVIVGPNADVSVVKSGPAKASPNGNITYTITVTNSGPSDATNVTLADPTPSGLTFLAASGACASFPCSLGTMTAGSTKTTTAIYAISSQNANAFTNTATVSSTVPDPNPSNNSSSATTIVNCPAPPALIAPVGGVNVASPVHFSWNPIVGAASYEVFVSNGGPALSVGTTTNAQLDAAVTGDGVMSWFVVATVPGCGSVQSITGSFTICGDPATPQPSVVAQTVSGQSFTIQWDAIPGATKYEVDEATDASFSGATTSTTTSTSATFTHTAVLTPQTFFYRVRAFAGCAQKFGAYSPALRVIIVPLPSKNDPSPNVNVPAGSKQPVTQQLFIPGIPGGNYSFSASSDEPWVTVSPSTGVLTPNGITLTLTTDPSNLPNGTFTSTIVVTLTPIGATSNARTEVTTVVSVPVSISLVTPVQSGSKGAPPANALIFPSVGHLDGIDSHWQSDIRVSNIGGSKQNYLLSFTPSDPTQSVKSTTITIDAGATTALDDIVKNWYGFGTVGDAAAGVLEIHPVDNSGKALTTQSLVTVASSRTYDVAASGTLGQFVPAIPFGSFIGRAANNAAATILSLQQIAQSSAFRTNFGVVEASGQPANVLLSVFDDSGKNLKDIPVNLAAFQQVQLNSLLAQNNITLSDGRVEVKVTGGDGKITSFASVVDNFTQDPLLVTGIPLGQTLASRYVLPGVADISNGLANWRTDMRVFNASSLRQDVTFTFYPLTGYPSKTLTATTTLEPGEVKTFDNILQTLFNTSNIGGALHVAAQSAAPLVISGRTYNQTSTGTYGQFVGAVTAADAIGTTDRALQILQVEDSPRYRTNVGIAEVTGQAATVELSVVLPDSRVTPKLTIPLAANEYRLLSPAIDMGLGNIYNARISIRVTSGVGKITAHGSVIDMKTQDPTFVPAQ